MRNGSPSYTLIVVDVEIKMGMFVHIGRVSLEYEGPNSVQSHKCITIHSQDVSKARAAFKVIWSSV